MAPIFSLPTATTPLPRRSSAILRSYHDAVRPIRRRSFTVGAGMERKGIDEVSKEWNAIASQDLDFAPARRCVREAFYDDQQDLDHFLFKKAPTGIEMKETYEKNSKGVEIFLKCWWPRSEAHPKGAVFFCHGYGDTCTFFFEGIAKRIAHAGYAVYAMDYPGFGLTDGLHGYIPSFDGMVDQVIEQYAAVRERKEIKSLPHFLLGQSMGAAVALKIHLKQPGEWDGLILVAPMCKIAEDVTPPGIVLRLLKFMSYLLPEAKLFPIKDLGDLAFRDPNKRKQVQYNVISYSGQMRLKTAMELLKATGDVENQLEKVDADFLRVSSRLLILHGAADKVTDPAVSKFLYEKACSTDKTLILYEESYHSILEGEPDDRIDTVLFDMISWLDSRTTSISG